MVAWITQLPRPKTWNSKSLYAVKGKIIEIIYKYLKGYFSRLILTQLLGTARHKPRHNTANIGKIRPNQVADISTISLRVR
jgi:hypothetical protein